MVEDYLGGLQRGELVLSWEELGDVKDRFDLVQEGEPLYGRGGRVGLEFTVMGFRGGMPFDARSAWSSKRVGYYLHRLGFGSEVLRVRIGEMRAKRRYWSPPLTAPSEGGAP